MLALIMLFIIIPIRQAKNHPPKTRMKKYIVPVLFAIVAGVSARAEDIITFWVRDSDQAIVDPLVKAYNARGGTNVKLSVIPAMQFVTSVCVVQKSEGFGWKKTPPP